MQENLCKEEGSLLHEKEHIEGEKERTEGISSLFCDFMDSSLDSITAGTCNVSDVASN